MPTIPLYSQAAAPDGWHRVISPGGYEWWYFDAEDARQDVQVAAIFFQGFVFHPGYLRRYARYLRRPTRIAPPVPAEYPCAYFVVYEKGRILAQFMKQYRADEFSAQDDHAEVRIGNNVVTAKRGALELSLAATPWRLTARGPKLLAGQTLAAELRFEPIEPHPPVERTFLSRAMTGADHRWVVANPRCDVSGTISFGGRSIDFNGRGYHDHNYGTAPLGPGLRRWIWGRVLLKDSAWTFHFARARDQQLPDEVHLLRVDDAGVQEIAIRDIDCDWSRFTAAGLRYPARLRFEKRLELSAPRVIDSSPFYLRLMYEAKCDGKPGQAFCEVAQPNRLRWPVLGRMIEMSIDRD